MNAVGKLFLSMSVSGGLLILALCLGMRLLKDRLSRQWQYYIWLIVLLRLLLPFGPEASLLGGAYQAADRAVTQAAPSAMGPSEAAPLPAVGPGQDSGETDRPTEHWTAASPLPGLGELAVKSAWVIWLAGALGLLIRKVTLYQSFLRYIQAGLTPVSDLAQLDRLSAAAERAGVKRPVELCVNPLIASPLLLGFFHPCIVLPGTDVSEKDFLYIALHELTHYRRRDMFYKWLVQATVCLHWFNPLVHLMSREITKACEFSCDEAVLARMGGGSARDYGETLLDAMAAVGKYKEHLGAVTLSENKELLKERLDAIMNYEKKPAAVRLLTGALTVCLLFGAVFIGVYPAAASERAVGKLPTAADKRPAQRETGTSGTRSARLAETAYAAGSLPLFQMAFCNLDAEAQSSWLDRLYADQQIAFFGAAVNLLDEDCAQIRRLAEAAYKDGDAAYFSTLAMHMSEKTLEAWLDRALEDGEWFFQSILLDTLGRDGDEQKEAWEKEWEAAQAAEYGAAGVTVSGKDYYYRGQLVNVFLDLRPNKAFYTLNMNPKGTVNIKILRNAENAVTGVSYMTEAETMALLSDMEDPDDEPDVETLPVALQTVAAGKTIFLGEYTLSEGDRIFYDVLAETGKGLQIGFAEPGDVPLNKTYYSVKNLRQKGEALECTASFTVGPPVKPGTYRLFLRATDGALGNVKGSISIALAEAAS